MKIGKLCQDKKTTEDLSDKMVEEADLSKRRTHNMDKYARNTEESDGASNQLDAILCNFIAIKMFQKHAHIKRCTSIP